MQNPNNPQNPYPYNRVPPNTGGPVYPAPYPMAGPNQPYQNVYQAPAQNPQYFDPNQQNYPPQPPVYSAPAPNQEYYDPNYPPAPIYQENPYFTSDFAAPGAQDQTSENSANVFFQKVFRFLTKWWWILMIVAVILSIIVVTSIVLSRPRQTNTPVSFKNVIATINAPKTLPQGTPGDWEVTVENKEKLPVANILVELKFDTDFQYIREYSPKPENPEGTKYSIASLDEAGGRSSSAKIRFQGVLTGKPDIEIRMSGTVSFQVLTSPGQLSNVFNTKIDEVRTKITSPQIDLSLTPTETNVQNSGEAEFTVKIKNITDQEMRDLRLRMVYPSGQNTFTYTSSEFVFSNTGAPKTQPDDGDNTWLIARLAGGTENVLKVRGRVLGASQAKLTFGAEVALKTNTNDYRVIRENFKDITIIAQPMIINSYIAGKENSKLIIPGETLNFVVTYKNDSQQTFNDVKLTTFLEDNANILDLSTISFQGGQRGDTSGTQITWRATQAPQLGIVRPSQSGQFQYSVKVKELASFLNTNLDQTKYTVRPGVQISAQNLQQIEYVGDVYKGKGELEFFQDVPVFKQVNPTTNRNVYSFTWRIRNWQNEVTQIAVRTTSPLPPGTWTGKVTPAAQASAISYSDVDGTIIWNVGKINSYTGRSSPEISITFEMEVPRDSSGNSTNQTALRAPQITGIDVFTGENYSITGEELVIKK